MFCLLAGVLFFPFLLPFLLLRFIFRLVFGLVMLPFVLMIVVFAMVVAFLGVITALLLPAMPFVLLALAVWAIMRHSRVASAYPNS